MTQSSILTYFTPNKTNKSNENLTSSSSSLSSSPSLSPPPLLKRKPILLPEPTSPPYTLNDTGLLNIIVSESESDSDFNPNAVITTQDHTLKSIIAPDSPSIQCPFCNEPIPIAWEDTITEIYQCVLTFMPQTIKNEQRLSNANTHSKRTRFIELHQFDALLFRNLDSRMPQLQAVCTKHQNKSILLQSITNQWPQRDTIEFEKIPARIHALVSVLDQVVEYGSNIPECLIYTTVLNDLTQLGQFGFRNQKARQARMTRNRVGYYGPKGAFTMMDTLSDLYIHDPQFKLTADELNGLKVSEFIQEVLVPTTAVLLIQADLNQCGQRLVSFEEAWQYMRDTSDYGDLIAPL